MFSVEVTYPGQYYPELDSKLENFMGQYAGASGMGFGQRDLSFGSYELELDALNMASRIEVAFPEVATRIVNWD